MDSSCHDLVLAESCQATIHHKAKRLIGRFGFTLSDLPDLEQEITIDLLRRSSDFDPKRSQWSTFASRCVDHRIVDIIRSRCTDMRNPERACHIDDHHVREDMVEHGCAANTQDLKIDLAAAWSCLPERLQHLCRRLVTDSVSSIAAQDGRSRWQVYRDIAAIRRAFTVAGLADYC